MEVSSPGVLRFLGLVDTTAPRGSAGVVLLDPEEIAVEQVGSASTSASVIDGDSLSQMLRSGNNVVLAADDSITINYIIDGRPVAGGTGASGTVSMTAGVIEINAPVITNNASINLEANSGDIIITGQGRLYVANGVGEVGSEAIELNAAGSIQSDGHIISLGTIELRATLDVELRTALAGLANGSSSSGIGQLIIVAEQGSVALAGASVNDSVNVTASDGVSLSGSSLIADSDVTIDGGSGSITLSGGINAAIDSDGNVELAHYRRCGPWRGDQYFSWVGKYYYWSIHWSPRFRCDRRRRRRPGIRRRHFGVHRLGRCTTGSARGGRDQRCPR